MGQYLPISGNPAAFLANLAGVKGEIELDSEGILMDLAGDKLKDLPKTLQELDREAVAIIDLSVDAAMALKIPFGAADNKLSRRIFIQEYKKYKEISNGNDTIHVGIGIRWVVNIRKINLSADISSLPMVTASAQFNNISASVSFEVVGISSQGTTMALPSNVDLKADTYVELKNAFEKIKSQIWQSNTQITPSVLGIFGKVKSDEEKTIRDAVAITYALDRIRKGRSLNRTLVEMSIHSDTARETVKSVYQEILRSSDEMVEPDARSRDQAKNYLDGML